jgi:hypothetical protein
VKEENVQRNRLGGGGGGAGETVYSIMKRDILSTSSNMSGPSLSDIQTRAEGESLYIR